MTTSEPSDPRAVVPGSESETVLAAGVGLVHGTRLGPYTITSFIGAGGMGEVYRAHDSRLQRDVAIKVLPQSDADPARQRRLLAEAQAAGALNHPNILSVYDVGTYDRSGDSTQPVPYIVMELLEGETLRRRLAAGPLPVATVVDVIAQIARGLAAAHDKGIVHRDLKPDNVFITVDGRVKILDFGLARRSRPGAVARSAVAAGAQRCRPDHLSGARLRRYDCREQQGDRARRELLPRAARSRPRKGVRAARGLHAVGPFGPDARRVRDLPGFQDLMRRMGFPAK